MSAPDYEPLFYWVQMREELRRRKDMGLSQASWTVDPILATYRFCNVRREDDRVTIWIRQNIRERFVGHPYLWLMLCIARQINWPATLAELINNCDLPGDPWPSTDGAFGPQWLAEALNRRKAREEKLYTGAYMISAPPTKGADKQAYIAETVIGGLWRRRESFRHLWIGPVNGPSLQRVHAWLMQSQGWGQFMAYQAVVDMRFTPLLDHAPDVETWAAAGPGTLRGLNRIYGRPLTAALSQDRALSEMRAIYKIVQQETGVAMDFSDVPNILCETDKYLRVKNGEGKPRALYVAGRGA